MSGVRNLISLSVSHVALNPVVTATVLWALTRSPATIQDRIFDRFKQLQDPYRLARIVKVLKGLLVLGLLGHVNRQLNKLALNAWRLRSEKKNWDLKKEVAVITGGCSGIGELIVKGLVKKGVTVAVLDIQQLPQGLQGYANIKFFACDVTDPAAVNSAAERIRSSIGSPSILINNAGVAQPHTILGTSDEWLRKIVNVNLLSNWYTVKAFLPDMLAKKKGHILTMGSTASFVGVAGMADYTSTKAAVLAFHESLNLELRLRYNAPEILTTSIHPHWASTPMTEPWKQALHASKEALVDPQLIADAIVRQIERASGAQLFVPASVNKVGRIRGLPNWIQEPVRTMVSRAALKGVP